MRSITAIAAIFTIAAGVWALGLAPNSARAADERVELGDVDWHRDFQKAKERARETGKPMFVLFTEVPGCSTVRGYGKRVLSDRLVVEAIEREFVPVAVFNNVQGEDREVLESFGEPTWNNPAVRILRPDRTALTDRLYGDYSVEATVETMIDALESHEGTVPRYLQVLAREHRAAGRAETAVFGMYCFWSGEAGFGQLEGVLRTRPGFLEGTEVVEVTYDPEVVSLTELARRAKKHEIASEIYATSASQLEATRPVFGDAAHSTDDDFRYAADDDNHVLQGTAYEGVEMTPLQTTRVNSSLAAGTDPDRFLAPSQRQRVEGRSSRSRPTRK